MATSNHSDVPQGFKEIPGYAGKYFINEQGQVWSVAKRSLMSQQWDEKHPYPWLFLLCEDGKSRTICVHRLMGKTWLPSPLGKIGSKRGEYCVNHKDGNKLNNHMDNLEWVTSEENLKHAWRTGLNQSIGEQSPSSKVDSSQVRLMRELFIQGKTLCDLAGSFGLSMSGVHDICRYRRWKHQDHDLLIQIKERSSSVFIDVMLELS
jgi:hypothetical protein